MTNSKKLNSTCSFILDKYGNTLWFNFNKSRNTWKISVKIILIN